MQTALNADFIEFAFKGPRGFYLGFNTPWRLEDNFKWASLLIVCNFIGVYNAFNERVSGYGYLDNSHWPLKDDEVCISVANKNSALLTSSTWVCAILKLTCGIVLVRFVWAMATGISKQAAHLGTRNYQKGWEKSVLEWTHKPRNRNEIVQIYLDDHTNPRDKSTINQFISKRLFWK